MISLFYHNSTYYCGVTREVNNMQECETYWATIYLGLRPHYDEVSNRLMDSRREQARITCQKFCDLAGSCVTITDTEFIYTKGNEPGLIIGFIHYPCSACKNIIESQSKQLAQELMVLCEQNRVSIMYPDKTIMLENTDG